jgi:methyltransferase (TIGR00027 family)
MAQGVLAERALLTHLGVVDDPLAEGMLAPGMARLLRVARRLPRRTWGRSVTMAGLATRVVWVDRQVAAALEDGICQVALIGAGYDSRTWRFAREGVRFFELDHPVTQQDKRQCAPPGPGPTYVEADLNTHDAGEVLVAGGLDAQRRSLFVVEGVSMYLDEDVVRRQLAGLAKVSAPGSRALVDFMPPRAATTTESGWQDRLQRLARIGSGEPFKLLISPDRAADLVGGAGWTVDERASFRSAARSLIGRASGLPVDVVNEHKTLIAASL